MAAATLQAFKVFIIFVFSFFLFCLLILSFLTLCRDPGVLELCFAVVMMEYFEGFRQISVMKIEESLKIFKTFLSGAKSSSRQKVLQPCNKSRFSLLGSNYTFLAHV
jgi:hypothetical protein